MDLFKNRKVFDVTVDICETMQVYGNMEEKKPKFINTCNFDTQDFYESVMHLDCHAGTHIDAPLHFVEGGEKMESIELNDLMASAKVIDLTEVDGYILKSHIEKYDITEGDFIIFKTKNSFEDFHFNYIALSPEVAEYLVERKVKGVGTDGLSIGRGDTNKDVHRCLLSKKLVVIEGLALKDISEDEYFMVALPLKTKGLEAAPARVLLVK